MDFQDVASLIYAQFIPRLRYCSLSYEKFYKNLGPLHSVVQYKISLSLICFLPLMLKSGVTVDWKIHCLQGQGLTHWGWVTHICICKLTTIGSDNSLSPGRRQAIIWTNAGIFLIGPLRTNFNEMLIEIHTFHSRKCTWKCRLENGRHFVSASMC